MSPRSQARIASSYQPTAYTVGLGNDPLILLKALAENSIRNCTVNSLRYSRQSLVSATPTTTELSKNRFDSWPLQRSAYRPILFRCSEDQKGFTTKPNQESTLSPGLTDQESVHACECSDSHPVKQIFPRGTKSLRFKTSVLLFECLVSASYEGFVTL